MIIVIGISDGMNSKFAKRFSDSFNAPLLSIYELANKLLDTKNQDDNSTVIVAKAAEYLLEQLLKSGVTVVYDGPSDKRSKRNIIAKKARKAGYEPLYVWVQGDAYKHSHDVVIKSNRASITVTQSSFELPAEAENYVAISRTQAYSNQLKVVLKHLACGRSPMINSRKQVVNANNRR